MELRTSRFAASGYCGRSTSHGRTILQGRSREAQARRRRRIPRRGHPGDHQGAARIRRVLRRGLSGRADLAPDGRARRRQRDPGRARRPFREQRQRGDRRGDARGLGELSAARRGDVQVDRRRQCGVRCAVESRLRRRHRRRAGHHRRGLRRRLLDHAGARASVRDEIADLAARSAPEPAVHRQRGEEGLRAVGGHQHAGDARGAHPRLPRARPLRGERQCAAVLHAARRDGEPAPADRPHRAAARELPAREGEDREALAGRGEVHRGQQAQRVLRRRPHRHRHRDAGRDVQHHAARAGARRPRRRARPFARAALRDERHLSADRPRAHPLRAKASAPS